MILPKEFFDQIEYFEYSTKIINKIMHDIFVIHFKQWWRIRRTIKVARIFEGYSDDGHRIFKLSPSAADLYNQLNSYALSTFEEKLDGVKQKYNKDETGKVLYLKPKPKDIDE